MRSNRHLARREFLKGSVIGAAALASGCARPPAARAGIRAYLGTYTEGTASEGLYHCLFDSASGALRLESVTKGVRNPSFLAFGRGGERLYSVEEVDDRGPDRSGGVVAYAVDRGSGALRETSRALSGGAHPAHLSVHDDGRHLLVANYTGGTVSVLDLDEAGALSGPPRVVRHEWVGPARPPRQEAPHPHAIYHVGSRIYVPDLGLDRIVTYDWNPAAGTLVPLPDQSLPVRRGDGPRHMAFHPRAPFAYLINELSSSIMSLRLFPGGTLHPTAHVSTLPAGYQGENACADIHVHPSGRFLYGSNRGHNSIVVAEIAAETGQPTVVQHHPTGGSWPRNFAIDPTGRFLLVENQKSGNVVTLAIDPSSGRLSETGHVLEVPAPVCLLFAPGA